MTHIILSSGSEIRAELLRNARISFDQTVSRIDEDSVKMSMEAEQAPPRAIADTLAEMKAMKVSARNPQSLVIGCDQVLEFNSSILSKPVSPEICIEQLKALQGNRHQLLSAAVICEDAKPVWRHIGKATVTMRSLSDDYIHGYVARNWDSIRHSVGGYKLEEEGSRLLSGVHGDYFHVLGLPLLEIISYLVTRGAIEN